MGPTRYALRLKGDISCTAIILITIVGLYTRQDPSQKDNDLSIIVHFNVTLAVMVILISLSIPRNHQAFCTGRTVDGESSSSIIGLVSFAWASPLVTKIGKNVGIGLESLPALSDRCSAKTLDAAFHLVKEETIPSNRTLWRIIWVLYRSHFLWQAFLSVPLALLAFVPHVAMGQILVLLESRTERQSYDSLLVRWALVLGVGIGVSSWLENWLLWIAQSRISIPMTKQLSTALFDKATKITLSGNGQGQNDCRSEAHKLVNLAAIDAPRIATIAGFLYSCILQPLKVIVAIALLGPLLGWQSLSIGLACLVLVSPLQSACFKRLSTAESIGMTHRDAKMGAVTEVLLGIRYIKIAALESEWEAKINTLRDNELQAQKTVFHWQALSLALHLLGQMLVSAASLGMYGMLYGRLTPSVAFPALSIFGYLQFILGIIPELLSGTIAAFVSMKRVNEFLSFPEPEQHVMHCDCIGVVVQRLNYGSGDLSNQDGLLPKVEINFPHQALSLVCGPTGAGKSLLLMALLGECNIMPVTVKRPKPPLSDDAFASCASGSAWTVESMVAYVAETPWIEMGTVRANILFGLPLDSQRYQKVLNACALTYDLNEFEDHDLTDIGPSGVNLSGGQKARISLARALYSRAGILLLDDIFSAVDVHTAKHLFDHGLTGELAAGRTRVLITHHVELCLGNADFLVELQGRKVKFAGKIEKVQSGGNLISSQQTNTHLSLLPEDRKQTMQHTIIPCPRKKEIVSSVTDDKVEIPMKTKTTRKFVQDEIRGQSAVPWRLFRRYIAYSGDWPSWTILTGCYVAYNIFICSQVCRAVLHLSSSPQIND